MSNLEGRKALVTGASAGLGAGISQELVARGATVLMCSRSSERIGAAAEKIAAHLKEHGAARGVGVWQAPLTIAADITDPKAAPTLAAAAQEAFGRLDILVCNAGGPPPGDFADLRDRDWEEAFRLLLLSPVRLVRACLPMLRASGSGRILFVASISGLQPVQRLLLSNVLRPAVMGLVRHLGGELAPDGILVNALAPGFFATERAREVQAAIAGRRGISLADVQAELAARIPLARCGEPRELGSLAAHLASQENSYVTGQTLVIDGGLTTAP
jgi:3-oxoacyl-[acyl-carrier protein] reductase